MKAHHRYYDLKNKRIVTVRGDVEKDGRVFVSCDGELEYVEAKNLIVPIVYDEIRALSNEEMRWFLKVFASDYMYDVELALAIAKCHGEFNLPDSFAHTAFKTANGTRASLNDALAQLESASDCGG